MHTPSVVQYSMRFANGTGVRTPVVPFFLHRSSLQPRQGTGLPVEVARFRTRHLTCAGERFDPPQYHETVLLWHERVVRTPVAPSPSEHHQNRSDLEPRQGTASRPPVARFAHLACAEARCDTPPQYHEAITQRHERGSNPRRAESIRT